MTAPDVPRRQRRPLAVLLLLTVVALQDLPGRLHRRLGDRDDTGLSTPEVAALTVLGLAIAAILAIAVKAYVQSQTAKIK